MSFTKFYLEFGIFPIAVMAHKTASLQSIYNLVYIRCARVLQVAKLSPSILVQHVFLSGALCPWCFLGYNHLFGFRHVRSYCNTDYALAGLTREIRIDYLCIHGFECSELEQVVYRLCTLPASSFYIISIVPFLHLFFGMMFNITSSTQSFLRRGSSS